MHPTDIFDKTRIRETYTKLRELFAVQQVVRTNIWDFHRSSMQPPFLAHKDDAVKPHS